MARITLLLAVLGATLLASGCAQPLCSMAAPLAAQRANSNVADVTTAEWMMLLLRGPSHTCLGESVVPENLAPEGMRLRPRATHLLRIDGAGPGQHIVWLHSHEDHGALFGPVAIVQHNGGRLDVLALGTLLAPTPEVSLRVDRFGIGRALWAQSRQCIPAKGPLPTLCHEQLQVLPLQGDRIVSSLEAPIVDLTHQQVQALGNGWYRTIQWDTQVTVRGDSLLLQETMATKEVTVRSQSVPPRRHKQSQAMRTLQFTPQGGWCASGEALWGDHPGWTSTGQSRR